MKTLIYFYKHSPAYGWSGEYLGGHSISVLRDGTVELCDYLYDVDEPVHRSLIKVDRETVRQVKRVIQRKEKTIREMPHFVDNKSRDGYMDEFCFYEKQVWTLNLEEHKTPFWVCILALFIDSASNIRNEQRLIRYSNCLIDVNIKIFKILGIDPHSVRCD